MLEKKLGKKVDITVKTGSNDSALYELAEIISSTDYLLEIKTICGTVMIIGINSIETIIPTPMRRIREHELRNNRQVTM